jgi:heavy metal sensor kinase
MSLATRLTAFFLGALALLLGGFATTLYLVERSTLNRRVDEHLDAAMHTLVAAVEFTPKGLEWEPNQRLVWHGKDVDQGRLVWTITDEHGRLIDRSRGTTDAPLNDPRSALGARDGARPSSQPEPLPDGAWRTVRRRLESSSAVARSQRRPEGYYPVLLLTVSLNVEAVGEALNSLVRVLVVLSAGLWLLAAALGGWFCRRALRPVRRMAEAARLIGAAELDQRLPVLPTGDELQDLGDSFNDLLSRLQEAFERQRRFTGDASHQLRTPLAAMLGQIDVALRRDRPTEDYRRTLALVRDQAAHLGRIVEMLLFLARADAEAKLPDLQDLDLADWLEIHLRGWSAHPRAGDVRLEVPSGPPRYVRVHPPLLGQLVDNLLENACKYSEPATPIVVRLAHEPGAVLLSVEDRGCGIRSEDLPHLFDPFFRSPEARRAGRAGVGLGLAVGQRIALAFHGTILAESAAGDGSRFTLWLPEVVAEPQERSEDVEDTEGVRV